MTRKLSAHNCVDIKTHLGVAINPVNTPCLCLYAQNTRLACNLFQGPNRIFLCARFFEKHDNAGAPTFDARYP